MIRRHRNAFRLALILIDVCAALVVVYSTWILRFGAAWDEALRRYVPEPAVAALVIAILWAVSLWFQGAYGFERRWTFKERAIDVARGTFVFVIVVLALLYVFNMGTVSRLYLVAVFTFLGLLALAQRTAARYFVRLMRDLGYTRHIVVVGANERAQHLADSVEAHHELALKVAGHVLAPGEDPASVTRPILGDICDIEAVIHDRIVDEVAICLPDGHDEAVADCLNLCEQEGRNVRVVAPSFHHFVGQGLLEEIDGVPVVSYVHTPDRLAGIVGKRILDVVGAAVALVLLAPLFAIVAIVVRLDSSGPALFRQERVGVHGRTFQILKFRTMCADAERQLESIRELNTIQGQAFKLERDPRITRVGRFLRKSSIDELPQLWNVLRGQMSLVGPRPPLVSEVAAYDVWHRRRLSMKPGITGLWQVRARHESVFDRWVQMDLEYIDGWSLWLDLKILLRTVPAVMMGSGR